MKALVIGANGYIGRHISKLLIQADIPFTAADLQKQSVDGFSNYFQIDLLDKDCLKKLFDECRIVFLFAGRTGTLVSFAESNSFVNSNEIGLLNVLNTIKEKKDSVKIIFPSSRLVYKGQKDFPLKETAPKEFKTIYAINKFACEQYLQMYEKVYKIPYIVFRICVPYGSMLTGNLSFGTLSGMLNNAQSGKDIVVFGDGSQKRSFIHVEDLCQIIFKASFENTLVNDIYNIAGPDVLSISDVAKSIAKKFDVGVKYVPWPLEHSVIESGDTVFDESKLQSSISYKYKHTFDQWVDTLIR